MKPSYSISQWDEIAWRSRCLDVLCVCCVLNTSWLTSVLTQWTYSMENKDLAKGFLWPTSMDKILNQPDCGSFYEWEKWLSVPSTSTWTAIPRWKKKSTILATTPYLCKAPPWVRVQHTTGLPLFEVYKIQGFFQAFPNFSSSQKHTVDMKYLREQFIYTKDCLPMFINTWHNKMKYI